MIKKLVRHGNSLALVIDKAILDLLRIDHDTPLELITDGDVIVIKPERDEDHEKKLHLALEAVNEKYGRALKRLAE